MTAIALNTFFGWSVANSFAKEKNDEDAVKQGKSYYFLFISHSGEFSNLGTVLEKINNHFSPHRWSRQITVFNNVASILVIPFSLFTAAVKHGHFKNLSERTIVTLNFFVEHLGDLMQVAMLASTVALIALGHVAYGMGIITALAVDLLDQKGFFSYQVSLFKETYLSSVGDLGNMLSGTLLNRIFSACSLFATLLPFGSRFIYQKMDLWVHNYFKRTIPTLQELDAPCEENKELSFAMINLILNSTDYFFEINPAHYTKFARSYENMPEDRHFGQFLELFDQVDWRKNYPLILKKLKDDERFNDFIAEKFPTVKRTLLEKETEKYVLLLAQRENKTKEEYVANWLREQMVQLDLVLSGKKRAKGSQRDLADANDNLAKLLPYLKSLKNRVEREDTLLKIAIEGGDYCTTGIKRASNELLQGALNSSAYAVKDATATEAYELQIKQLLHDKRKQIYDRCYDIVLKRAQTLKENVHIYDNMRLVLGLGFVPMTRFEQNRIELVDILTWELHTFTEYRTILYDSYANEYEDAIKEMGEIHFGTYIRQMLTENKQLTQDQRDEILEKFTERNDGGWSYRETNERFHRLLFYKLGIIRLKKFS